MDRALDGYCVQAKYRAALRGAVSVSFSSSWADKNGSHRAKVDKSSVDVYAIYCPDTDEVYYVDPSIFDGSVALRISPAKNGQLGNINLAENYKLMPL